MEQDQPEQLDYELVEWEKSGIFQLLHCGRVCICPFQPVVPKSDGRGGIIPTQTMCNSGCPLAQVHTRTYATKPPVHFYQIFCGGQPLERQVKLTRNSSIETVESLDDVKIINLDAR